MLLFGDGVDLKLTDIEKLRIMWCFRLLTAIWC